MQIANFIQVAGFQWREDSEQRQKRQLVNFVQLAQEFKRKKLERRIYVWHYQAVQEEVREREKEMRRNATVGIAENLIG